MKKSLEQIYSEIQNRQMESIQNRQKEEDLLFEQREIARQKYLNDIKIYEAISASGRLSQKQLPSMFKITFAEADLISIELRIFSLTSYQVRFPNGDIVSGSSDQTVELIDVQVTAGVMTIQIEDNLAINGISFISGRISEFEIMNSIDNVVTIGLASSVITRFINNGFTPNSLINLLLANNRLPVSQVNSIISWILTGGQSDGILSLDGQTPPAPPSGQAITDRIDLLVNYNWTIPID